MSARAKRPRAKTSRAGPKTPSTPKRFRANVLSADARERLHKREEYQNAAARNASRVPKKPQSLTLRQTAVLEWVRNGAPDGVYNEYN